MTVINDFSVCLAANPFWLSTIQPIPQPATTAHKKYNAGVKELQTHKIKTAVDFFNESLCFEKNTNKAASALALIYTLNKNWELAHSNACLALKNNENLENDLINLCLMNASYEVNQSFNHIKGTFKFDSFITEVQKDSDLDLSFLPLSVKLTSFANVNDRPICFVAASSDFFKEYAVPLILSLRETNSNCNLIIHLFNPDPQCLDVLDLLKQDNIPPVYITYEEVDYLPQMKNIYCSAIRFHRLYELMKIITQPVLIYS